MDVEPTLTPAEEKFFTSKGADVPAPEAPEATPAPVETKVQPEAKAVAPKDDAHEPEKEAKAGGDPRKAMHEERERRKTVERERDEFKTNFTKLQSRLDTLAEVAKQSQQPKQDAAPEIPDVNVDPVGHFRAVSEQTKRELGELKAWKTAQEQQYQATNNVQRIAQIAQQKEAEFKTATPDYDDASTHLRNSRDAQLIAYGISDPMERQNIIAQDAITIAANALSQNRNPAQIIYDMAKASGFVAKAATTATKPNGNGGAAPTEAEKVAMAAAGQKAGGSLSQLGGATEVPTTLQKIFEMSDDDFAAATRGDKWRKLVEGSSR